MLEQPTQLHAEKAEQAALGCALLDKDCARKLVEKLTEDDFGYEPHRTIFRAIKNVLSRGRTPDHITVFHELQRLGAADECGGAEYLIKASEVVPALANFDDYVQLVKEAALRRKAAELTLKTHKAIEEGNGWRDYVAELYALAQQPTTEPTTIFVPLTDYREQTEREWLIGDLIGTGDLVLLYGRPKVGKSILCANLITGVAAGMQALGYQCRKGKVGVIALEDRHLLVNRLRKLETNQDDVFVAPTPLSINDIETIRQAVTELNINLLVIDPLTQFLRPRLKRERASISRDYDAVYDAMFQLRELAQETGCTVILVHHERKETFGSELGEVSALGSTALTAVVDVGLQLDTKEQGEERFWRLSYWGRQIVAGEIWLRLKEGIHFEPTDPPEPTTPRGKAMKVVVEELRMRPLRHSDLIELIRARVGCSKDTAIRAIKDAQAKGLIRKRADNFYELVDTGRLEPKENERPREVVPADTGKPAPADPAMQQKFPEPTDTDKLVSEVSDPIMPQKFHESLDTDELVSGVSQVAEWQTIIPATAATKQLSSSKVATVAMQPLQPATNPQVAAEAGDIYSATLPLNAPNLCVRCGALLSPISATPTCPRCWQSGDDIVARCTCGEPLCSDTPKQATCVGCGRQWRFEGSQWQQVTPNPLEPEQTPQEPYDDPPTDALAPSEHEDHLPEPVSSVPKAIQPRTTLPRTNISWLSNPSWLQPAWQQAALFTELAKKFRPVGDNANLQPYTKLSGDFG
jgi:archaellum biogenesis ATPase FlaH